MTMTSNILKNMEDPYRVELDPATNTWRILYLHHPELSLITDIDQDVPDDHPAVTLLTEGAFIALVKKASQEGTLSFLSEGNNESYPDMSSSEAEGLKKTIDEQNTKINVLEKSIENKEVEINNLSRDLKMKPSYSERYALKEKALNSIVQVVGIQELGDSNLET